MLEEIKMRKEWAEDVERVFLKADNGNDGLDKDEFNDYVNDEHVQAFLRRIGLVITPENAMELFAMIDNDGNGRLILTEFVEGCSRVVGNARQLDLFRVKYETDIIKQLVAAIYHKLEH